MMEKKRKREEGEIVEISEKAIETMLELLPKKDMIALLIKYIKPGSDAYNDLMDKVAPNKDFTKLFIHDLPNDITEEQVRDEFSKYGLLTDYKVIMDKKTDKSKGYGFVEYADPESCLKVFDSIITINNRTIRAKYAKKDVEASTSSTTTTSSSSSSLAPSMQPSLQAPEPSGEGELTEREKRKVIVRNLDSKHSKEDLIRAFKQFGDIEEAFVCYEKGTQVSRGFGFVTFREIDATSKALERGSIDYSGHTLTCNSVDTNKSEKSKYGQYREPRESSSQSLAYDWPNDRGDRMSDRSGGYDYGYGRDAYGSRHAPSRDSYMRSSGDSMSRYPPSMSSSSSSGYPPYDDDRRYRRDDPYYSKVPAYRDDPYYYGSSSHSPSTQPLGVGDRGADRSRGGSRVSDAYYDSYAPPPSSSSSASGAGTGAGAGTGGVSSSSQSGMGGYANGYGDYGQAEMSSRYGSSGGYGRYGDPAYDRGSESMYPPSNDPYSVNDYPPPPIPSSSSASSSAAAGAPGSFDAYDGYERGSDRASDRVADPYGEAASSGDVYASAAGSSS